MENWLESEENKKIINDKDREIISQIEEKIHSELKPFYELCQRVNNVHPNSLEISRLKIMGTKRFDIDCEYTDYGTVSSYTKGSRGLIFNCSNIERLMANVLIDEYHQYNGTNIPGIWIDNEYHEPISTEGGYYHTLKEVLHKRFLLDDIKNWTEKQMLNTIDYFLLKTKSIDLPGDELAEEQKKDLIEKEKIKLSNLKKELYNSEFSLSKINSFHIGRSQKEKGEQIKKQNEIIKKQKFDITNSQKKIDKLNSSLLE